MEKLRKRLQHILCEQYRKPAEETARLLQMVQADGSLRGMNYHQEKIRGSEWLPGEHLEIMQVLAVTHPEVANRMLDFWIKTDCSNENWFKPQIGIPRAICFTMLMLGRKAGKDELKLRTILNRSAIKYTGQNRVWLAGIHVMKGVLYDEPEMVELGRETILSEIQITGDAGLQYDWSFHQHGHQLQFGTYGLSWFADMVFWATAFAGTKFALPQEKLALIVQYYTNGLRWTLLDKAMDISACGRQVIDTFPFDKYRRCRRIAGLLQKSGLLKELPEPEGSVCYPCSGYLIHRCKEFFFSVKMSSSRVRGSEVVNSENVLGRYSADGATMLYPQLQWDPASIALRNWYKVPGTTEVQNSGSLLPYSDYFRKNQSRYSCFADGDTGAAMMSFHTTAVHAEKAWFCFGKYIVCMGTNIKSSEPGSVVTTITQSIRNSKVLLEGKELAEGGSRSSGETEFTFEGMKYLLPEKGDFHFQLDHRHGNWNTIYLDHPSTPVSGKMLTVWQEHEKDIPGQYLYVIYPEKEPTPRIEYLRGESIIGIRTPEGIMLAFFRPGKFLDVEATTSGLYLNFKGIKKFIPIRE
ncbi:MAG: hypothetical protein IJY46_00655 [Lentisphaeria bacterium]|nr:hypothetical protein [Lentisphaeria bacterium]